MNEREFPKYCYQCRCEILKNFVHYECNHYFCEKCFTNDLMKIPSEFIELSICICANQGKIDLYSLIDFGISNEIMKKEYINFLLTLFEISEETDKGFFILATSSKVRKFIW